MPGVAAMAEYTDTLEGGGIEGGNVSASSFLNGSDSDQFPISVPMSPNQGENQMTLTTVYELNQDFTLFNPDTPSQGVSSPSPDELICPRFPRNLGMLTEEEASIAASYSRQVQEWKLSRVCHETREAINMLSYFHETLAVLADSEDVVKLKEENAVLQRKLNLEQLKCLELTGKNSDLTTSNAILMDELSNYMLMVEWFEEKKIEKDHTLACLKVNVLTLLREKQSLSNELVKVQKEVQSLKRALEKFLHTSRHSFRGCELEDREKQHAEVNSWFGAE